MRKFLATHQYLIIWLSGLVIIGALAVLVLQLNSSFLPTLTSLSQPLPTPPPAPSVQLTIQTNGSQKSLVVAWSNLPSGTTVLDIFRGKGADTSTWTLWKTILINFNDLNGEANFNLNASDLGYEYYVQALGGGSGGNSGGPILWSSGPGDPGTSSSTQGSGGGSGDGGNNGGNNGGNGGGQSGGGQNGNGSSTGGQSGNGSSTNGSSTGSGGGTGGSNSGTSGNPYYDPQIQITGYGTGNGDFWAQHLDQSIELGWQNLPANTTDIVFYRSSNQDGPWSQFLEQENPGSTGSYSLQIVDGTLNDPYYYEMIASQGTTSSATYGPIYLPPEQ